MFCFHGDGWNQIWVNSYRTVQKTNWFQKEEAAAANQETTLPTSSSDFTQGLTRWSCAERLALPHETNASVVEPISFIVMFIRLGHGSRYCQCEVSLLAFRNGTALPWATSLFLKYKILLTYLGCKLITRLVYFFFLTDFFIWKLKILFSEGINRILRNLFDIWIFSSKLQ